MPTSPLSRSKRLGQLLILLVALLTAAGTGLAAQPAAAATSTRVMLLGDSITGNNGCWRALLWQHLQTTGYTDVDFVGTQQNPYCQGSFDIDNEGHGGFQATGIVRDNQLPGWLSATDPDIVMMMLGTNDVWGHLPTSTILNAYTTLLGQMRANNPDVQLIVAQIPAMNPTGCADCAQGAVNLNNAIPGWASANSTERSPITVVDQWTGFDTATDTTDGVHPNETTGIQKLESRWYPALTAALDSSGAPDAEAPTTPGAPTASAVTGTAATLSWAASTDNVGVSGYDVVRVDGGTETRVASSVSRQVTVSGLTANTSYAFAVYAKDAAGNRSERSGTVAVTTTGGETPGTCSVGYRAVGDWGNGFQGEITIRNTGTAAISDWELGFTFTSGQTINNMWGGTPTQNGAAVSVTPAAYNNTIPTGGSATLGFIASRGSTNTTPTTFTLNDSTCATA
ncbi:cellulose binding domain-containing protein [Streptomyces sp. B6B3]|uniref:cellulose binding domain-containing protein n=1 Tax=Streptomyces sp. B6B3 TaxID=3153570 RepID=UPI00325C49DB